MTLRDDPRTYKKPVEEVAKLINRQLELLTGDDWADWLTSSGDLASVTIARIAISKLRSLGFISDLGIEAIRAEEAGK